MMDLDSLYADDVKKKKEGVEVAIPGLEGAYITVCAFDQIVFNEQLKKKRYLLSDPDNKNTDESKKLVAQIYVEQFIPSWRGVFLNGVELENTEKKRVEILSDPKYIRLLEFAVEEMGDYTNFKLKKADETKKH